MRIVLDIGNSRIKIGIFKAKELFRSFVLKTGDFERYLKRLITQQNNIEVFVISHVGNFNKDAFMNIVKKIPCFFVHRYLKYPFINKYKSPKTLGADRMVLASGAVFFTPNQNVLVIDAGSCITYDLITKKSEYYGGSISPGFNLRFKSLNDYTANLPLLELNRKEEVSLIGSTTDGSIQSGVIHGVISEISGIINTYQTIYADLTVILTGGDAKYLSKQLKNTIFVNSDFLLDSLNALYEYNTI